MASIADVVRHLVVHGPARNEREREDLLGQLDEAEGKRPAKSEKKEGK